MLFTSLTFLLFLSIVFALYWRLSERRVQNVALLLASYVFYGWWDYRFLILIIVSSLRISWARVRDDDFAQKARLQPEYGRFKQPSADASRRRQRRHRRVVRGDIAGMLSLGP